ncbi:DNA phosphorothioation system sulfurtransferase DndC [Streptomyces chumphonensis]|uniref:DNA phosphorothioation system sulfurtransferase DndC n=1 Tax=Streptomyces chumphonensis TaxID=1214925 RepID=A0A927EWC9_9ACTN|nr:DNA phosphorothioation system sulfurtransferase DndC [Streptomyces chumphonensis]MBD3930623.1 DNA phosphorothioation system sulfurtransferase DndC [Streptomyces chumphonensis]
MSTATRTVPFQGRGLSEVVSELTEEVRELYSADEVPWVIGYSGGKDSTAVLQLVWLALKELPAAQRTKPVHVISTDTLVENPIVASWVSQSLDTMKKAATEQDLPIEPHRLTPKVEDTFWVNLIGRGYPAPRPKFRWCTERMKIKPSNRFIRSVVRRHGEAILVLGIRKAESQARARAMAKHEKGRVRDRLSPNGNLPNSLVYSPIEDWTNDEVWAFLMQQANPWGYNNKDLLTMYQGASSDSECPLVVDDTTPSCGDSRFGCWTCTLVDQDKSMTAMIQNDPEQKRWMLPLLALRNELDDVSSEKETRDFRRMNGRVQLFNDRIIQGPYTQKARADWLRKLLEAQAYVRKNGPQEARTIELITMEELHEIRRLWVFKKHEVEDILPQIYEEATGEKFPGQDLEEQLVVRASEIELLKKVCGDDEIHFTMVRELLAVEREYRTKTRRKGLYEAIEKVIEKGFYEDEQDALEFAKLKQEVQSSGARAEKAPQVESRTFDEEKTNASA